MTFDQAKEAFREHKTCESADAYLHNAVLHKAADLIGAQALFNAVGEVASWLPPPTSSCVASKRSRPVRLAGANREAALQPNHPLPRRAL